MQLPYILDLEKLIISPFERFSKKTDPTKGCLWLNNLYPGNYDRHYFLSADSHYDCTNESIFYIHAIPYTVLPLKEVGLENNDWIETDFLSKYVDWSKDDNTPSDFFNGNDIYLPESIVINPHTKTVTLRNAIEARKPLFGYASLYSMQFDNTASLKEAVLKDKDLNIQTTYTYNAEGSLVSFTNQLESSYKFDFQDKKVITSAFFDDKRNVTRFSLSPSPEQTFTKNWSTLLQENAEKEIVAALETAETIRNNYKVKFSF